MRHFHIFQTSSIIPQRLVWEHDQLADQQPFFTLTESPEVADVNQFCLKVAESLGVPYEHVNFGRTNILQLGKLLDQYLGIEQSHEIIDTIREENLLFLKSDPASCDRYGMYDVRPKYQSLTQHERDTLKINAMLSGRAGMRAVATHRVIHALWQRYSADLTTSDPDIDLEIELLRGAVGALSGVDIHPGAKIGRKFLLDHGTGFVLGETAVIGDGCSMYHGSTVGASGAGSKAERHPKIGARFTAGNGIKLLGPMTIGDDVEIGTDAVVVNSPIGTGSTIAPKISVRGVVVPPYTRVIAHVQANSYLICALDPATGEKMGKETIHTLEWSGLRADPSDSIANIEVDSTRDLAAVSRMAVGEVHKDLTQEDGGGI